MAIGGGKERVNGGGEREGEYWEKENEKQRDHMGGGRDIEKENGVWEREEEKEYMEGEKEKAKENMEEEKEKEEEDMEGEEEKEDMEVSIKKRKDILGGKEKEAMVGGKEIEKEEEEEIEEEDMEGGKEKEKEEVGKEGEKKNEERRREKEKKKGKGKGKEKGKGKGKEYTEGEGVRKYGEGEKENIKERLFDAAMRGDVNLLLQIIQNDKYILEKVSMGDFLQKNPLHVAISAGKVACVDELLKVQPDLAEVSDRELRVALHIASAKGHLKIVELLVKADSAMCLARNRHGYNPLHIAAMKGNIRVLRELVTQNPQAARVFMDGGDTILHLCVNYNQLKSLRLLLDMITDQDFVNSFDSNGNNILHLAVLCGKLRIVDLLVRDPKIDVNARNKNGSTAMDILYKVHFQSESLSDAHGRRKEHFDCLEIGWVLFENGAKRCIELSLPDEPFSWQEKKKDTLMVVSSLIATMAFQVVWNPPGSIWQDTSSSHEAGKAISAYNFPIFYSTLMIVNTIGFLLSLTTILLLIFDLPAETNIAGRIRSMVSLMTIMSIVFAYTYSVLVVTPNMPLGKPTSLFVLVVVIGWAVVMTTYLIGSMVRTLRNLSEEKRKKQMARETHWREISGPDKLLESEADQRETIEAGRSGFDEASGRGKIEAGGSLDVESGGGGSQEAGLSGSTGRIQHEGKQKETIEIIVDKFPGTMQPSQFSAGGSDKIEAGGSIKVEDVESGSNQAGGRVTVGGMESESDEGGERGSTGLFRRRSNKKRS